MEETASTDRGHLKLLRDDIKSSGKFAISSYLKIEGVGGRRQITSGTSVPASTEKLQLKIEGGGGLRADF